MQITHFEDRQQLIDWAGNLKAVAEKREDHLSSTAIQQQIDEMKSGRFMLVVLGKVKRGKSTLCNALLGRQDDLIAPVDTLPASNVITKFFRQPEESVRVIHRDGQIETTDYRHIREFVTEQGNKANWREVACVEVAGPFSGLEKDLILVDSPGAGAIHEHHDAMLHGFLPQADAVIFLVTAGMPIAEDELELLRALKANDIKKVFFAINKVDDCDEDEICEGIEHNRKMLSHAGIQVDKIHRISAKLAMQGQIERSGLSELEAEIGTFLAKNKAQVLRSKFLAKTAGVAGKMADGVAAELELAGKTHEQLEAELLALQSSRASIKSGQDLVEQHFAHAWKNSVDDFDAALGDAEHEAVVNVVKHIRNTSALNTKKLGKELPSVIAGEVESVLTDKSAHCENGFREATEKLGMEYPKINIASNREVILRIGDRSTTIVKGAVVATTAVGTGVATIAAAGTVAAGIAATNTAAIVAASAASSAALTGAIGSTIAGGAVGGLGGALKALISFLPAIFGGSAPVLVTAPAWVALAGPVGWTLIGVGSLVIPIAYRFARLKEKKELEEAVGPEIKKIFSCIREERIPHLRKMGERVVKEYQLNLQNDLKQIETAIKNAIHRKETAQDDSQLQQLASELAEVIKNGKGLAA